MKTIHASQLGELHADGTVTLTDAGLDVLRAIFYGGLATCAAGVSRGRDDIKYGPSPSGGRKTVVYYQSAAQFLRHLLSLKVKAKFKLAKELAMLRHPAIADPDPTAEPPPTLTLTNPDDDHEPSKSSQPGSGRDHLGEPVQAAQEDDRAGPGVSGKPSPKRNRRRA